MKQKINGTLNCPNHLQSTKQGFVLSIYRADQDHVAHLPNYGGGKKVLIPERMYAEIRRYWDEDRGTLLDPGSGSIRDDAILVPNSPRLDEDKHA